MIIFWIVWLGGVILVLTFGAVLLIGAPYMPTLQRQRETALDLLDLKPGQVLVDLGSGDGSLLIAAAKRGVRAIGYEINPFLVVISRLRTLRYGGQVRIKWRNFWKADLSNTDGVFVFLIAHHMERLDKLVVSQATNKPIKLVSHAFKIPGRKPAAKRGALFLYRYEQLARRP